MERDILQQKQPARGLFRKRRGREKVRRSSVFLASVLILMLLFCGMFVHAFLKQKKDREVLAGMQMMVGALHITDLCLFTDARYVRHLSQTDLHAPFQNHPGALEHFPSGSLILPPAVLTGGYEKSH